MTDLSTTTGHPKSGLSRRHLLTGGISLAALATISPALAACGGGDSPPKAANNPASKAAALPTYTALSGGPVPDLPGAPGAELDGFLHYPADPQPIFDGIPGDGKPVTGLAQLNASLPPATGQNPYWQELNKRIGSPVNVQLVSAGDEFNSKIATMSAGDDFPDIMQINNAIPALDRFLEAKMLDLTPYLGGDKSAEYPALANIPTQYWESCVYNGKLFGLPISRGLNSALVMYSRTDLLAAVGIDAPPENFEDLLAAAKAVTDPKQNRWAFGNIPITYVRQMMGIPAGWQEGGDGQLINNLEDDRQTQALESVRALHEAGLLNPDVAAAPPAQHQQWYGSGNAAFIYGTYSAWGSLIVNFAAPADAVSVLPMAGFEGGAGTGWITGVNNNISVISQGSKDRIETLLKIANYLASPFGTTEHLFLSRGIEGRHFEFEGSDPIPVAETTPERELGINYLASPPPVLYNPAIDGWAEDIHSSQQAFAKTATRDIAQNYYSETASRKGAQLAADTQSLELDIIFGRQPVSAWTDWVTQWRADGGDKIRTELTEARAAE